MSDQSYSSNRRGGQGRQSREPQDRQDRQDRQEKFFTRPRNCPFCSDKSLQIDYKNSDMLRRYVHDDGKIRPRRQTGACAAHQRELAKAIKQARHLALLPFTGEVLR